MSVLVAAAFLFGAAGCGRGPTLSGSKDDALGKLPIFENLDGGKVDLGAERGKVIVINRWASWCGPCRQEIPGLLKLRKKYGERGVVVYGLDDEDADTQKSAARGLDIDYPLLKDPGTLKAPFVSSGYIPETFVLARDGRLAATLLGYQDEGEFEKAVAPLLEEKIQ